MTPDICCDIYSLNTEKSVEETQRIIKENAGHESTYISHKNKSIIKLQGLFTQTQCIAKEDSMAKKRLWFTKGFDYFNIVNNCC